MKFRQSVAALDQAGFATILMAAALSAFSVLALTVLDNPQLEQHFSSDVRDMHVVLYKADTGLQTLAARLNIPRMAWSPSDTASAGAAVEIPIAPEGQDASGLSAQIVELAPGMRVCCGGTGMRCDNADGSQYVYSGTVGGGADDLAVQHGELDRRLRFELQPLTPAEAIALELPSYQMWTASLLKATRLVPSESAHSTGAQQVPSGSTSLSCRLEVNGKAVATGMLQISETIVASGVPGAPPNRTLAGLMELQYRVRP